ncbi:hypothetical protein [Zavarzinia sp.]|uniref:hypothetical protein n=1 Tax=Zavarzinia sp. TaxID=2027920 RepID=UPI00356AA0FA
MITIEQPAMALNAHDISRKYQMWNSWDLASDERVPHIFGWVGQVAAGAAGGKLKNLIINCHGQPGRLLLGVGGVVRSNVGWFRQWRGKVDKIWLTACRPGFIQDPGQPSDGNLFVGEMAKAANCYVVASTETQWFQSNRTYPFGQIDTFEGLVLSYAPDGSVSWSHRYASNWSSNQE